VFILGQKMNATIGGAAFQFVAIKVACQLFAALPPATIRNKLANQKNRR